MTKRALLVSTLLQEPLAGLYNCFLAFILYKHLHASALQISLLAMLKPLVTTLSFYWSAELQGRLRTNLLGAGLLMRLPFILCLFFSSPNWLIAAAINYMFFYRAGVPAWMEILKQNFSREHLSRAFSISSAIGYAEGVLLCLGMAAILDHNPNLWPMFFAGAACLGCMGVLVQVQLPVQEPDTTSLKLSLRERLVGPWKACLEILRQKKAFAYFQWSFMAAGFAIMLIQPALPLFAVDILGVSHLQIATAIAVAKGSGFVLTSPFWGRSLRTYPIQQLATIIFLIMAFFPLFLVLAAWHIQWLYLAYFMYGIGQAGSHLIWNISGPHFAEHEESSVYTRVGVMMAGIRGVIAPPLGGFLCVLLGTSFVLSIGAILCLISSLLSRWQEKRSRELSENV